MKPDPGGSPLPFCGCRRDVDHASGFFNRETSEETQFHEPRLPCIQGGESLHRRIQSNQVEVDCLFCSCTLVQEYRDHAATSLGGVAHAGMVHKDLPHHAGGQREEMGSAVPVGRFAVYHAQIDFMDEGSGLQGVITALAGKVLFRHSAQFVVDKRNECISGRKISLIPTVK